MTPTLMTAAEARREMMRARLANLDVNLDNLLASVQHVIAGAIQQQQTTVTVQFGDYNDGSPDLAAEAICSILADPVHGYATSWDPASRQLVVSW